jgi:cyclopropane-fatty-acyl-phospholipid synthase
MDRLLRFALSRFVRRGSLELVTARGTRLTFGDGTEPQVAMRFADRAAERLFLWDPELRLGELFMDGRILIEEGSIYEFFQLVMQDSGGDRSQLPVQLTRRLRSIARWLRTENRVGDAKRNVAHHYDLDERLYRLFLDADRQYSCAYFERPDQGLDDAQLAKKRHIAAKLLVEPGHTVLDIGSGWGRASPLPGAGRRRRDGEGDHPVAGATRRLAAEGRRARPPAGGLVRARGLPRRPGSVRPHRFGRHVRARRPQVLRRLLRGRGAAARRQRRHAPSHHRPHRDARLHQPLDHQVHLPRRPSADPVGDHAGRRTCGLAVADVEVLRLHYAETLRAWRQRFMARREEAAQLYDERFCRMWECYLAMAEASFRFEDVVVFQLQLARRNDVVPLTRDYVVGREAAYGSPSACPRPSPRKRESRRARRAFLSQRLPPPPLSP